LIIIILPLLSYASTRSERIIITISDSPLLKKAESLGISFSEASELFDGDLRDDVESKLEELHERGIDFEVVDILTTVLHGAIIETSYPYNALLSIDPELKLFRDISLRLNLDKSSNLVRANEARKLTTNLGENITGAGVIVAVIDTGIDYTHPDLGGSIGPNEKVLKGYDFVDEDEDPIDRDGHGTEVAGIIAANGRLTGIAPQAKLLAYRVVDKIGNVFSSDLIRALERAVNDGARIVNLSLGTREKIDSLTYAIENVLASGIVVIAASGNLDVRAFGEPAGRSGVIAVGASLNNVSSSRDAEVVINPEGFELAALYMNGSVRVTTGVEGNLVYVNYAREEDVSSLNLTGKVALAERGGEIGELIYFSEKEENVAERGAIGLIVHNIEGGGFFQGNLIGQHNPPNYRSRIPVVSLPSSDGIYLRNELFKGSEMSATIFLNRSTQVGVDSVSSFSSRGPVSPFYIKPDLVAPGVNINTTSIEGTYSVVQGTSFAAPHVTGAAALLLQANPTLTPEEVEGILTSTSKVMTDKWKEFIPAFSQGSGRLDILSAVTSPVSIKPHQLVFQIAKNQPDHTIIVEITSIDSTYIPIFMNVSWNYYSNITIQSGSDSNKTNGEQPSKFNITASILDAVPGYYEGRITLYFSSDYPELTLPLIVYVNQASLNIEIRENIYHVSILSDEEYTNATLLLTYPSGAERTYILKEGDSVPLDISPSGEYWIEAEISTINGLKYARGTLNILDSGNNYSTIPLRFLIMLGIFMAVIISLSLIIIIMNRPRKTLFRTQV
jgi:minor extracellular serine protease Vpr